MISRINLRIICRWVILFNIVFMPTLRPQELSSPPAKTPILDFETKKAIIDSVNKELYRTYVFPEKAEKMADLLLRNLRQRRYEKIQSLVEFTQILTTDIYLIYRDIHIEIAPIAPETEKVEDSGSNEMPEDFRLRNYGFLRAEIFPGNIGYLDLRMFADAPAAGDKAVAAMNFLSDCDALIIDLRKNTGGSNTMVQLISSYLFEQPVFLSYIYSRRDDSTWQSWTQALVQGERLLQQPVYILTSKFTASAAEAFAYSLQSLGRATIIGEPTAGAAHLIEFHTFKSLRVRLRVPFARAIDPRTESNWEGAGVKPDIPVVGKDALRRAKKEAYQTLLKNTEDRNLRFRIEWVMEGLVFAENPVTLSERALQDFTGVFGFRRILLSDGRLVYKRDGFPEITLLPMGRDKFALEGINSLRFQFVRDVSGKIMQLIGLYDNGKKERLNSSANN